MAYSKKIKDKGTRITIDIKPEMVDLLLDYCLNGSPLITLKSLTNLKRLVDKISFSDDVLDNRIKFDLLKYLLELEIDKRIFQGPLLKVEALAKFNEYSSFIDEIMNCCFENIMGEADIDCVNRFVEERLTHLYLFENKDELRQVLDLIDLNENISSVNDQAEKVVGKLFRSIRDAKAVKKDAASDFCIGGDNKNFEPMVNNTINKLNEPANFIKTGVKGLNELLGGGWENSRLYIAYAPPKSWKSGLLMNAAIWACKYNEFKVKDPEKTPCVLYLTMENTSYETIKRLYQHITGQNIKNINMNKASQVIKDYIAPDQNVAFEIKYRANRSMNVNDLESMVNDLALEGKEVVFIVQDYIKRIRSNENNQDPRLEYGEATNDMVSLARYLEVPILTAMQINRGGIAKIETAIKSNKNSLAKLLEQSDAGESALVLENTDFAFSIFPEKSKTDNTQYLGMKTWISRIDLTEGGTKNPKSFILQPFENGMKLKEDYNTEENYCLENLNDNASFNPKEIAKKANELNVNRFVNKNKPVVGDGEIMV